MTHRPLLILIVLAALLAVTACGARRMSPFSPHRPATDSHRGAVANQSCLDCHAVKTLSNQHQASDNCLKCHRILQGE